MNYSRNNNIKQYGIRKRKPLEVIQENELNSGTILMGSEDPFDKLLTSPMKQSVTLKPLSHWAKKLADLEKSVNHSKKVKDLYEMSSPEDASPHRKFKKKPKPRKRKENYNFFEGLRARSNKPSHPKKAHRHTYSLTMKNDAVAKKTPLKILQLKSPYKYNSANRLPIFGLTSTPDKDKKKCILEPSFYKICSPIATEKTFQHNSTTKLKNVQWNFENDPKPIDTSTCKIQPIDVFAKNNVNNYETISDSSSISNICTREFIANGFTGFSPFAADPNRNDKNKGNSVPQCRNSQQRYNRSISPLLDESLNGIDRNVTLRRKCKRSYMSYSINPETHPKVSPDNVKQTEIKSENRGQTSLTTDISISNHKKSKRNELHIRKDKIPRKYNSNSEVSSHFSPEAKSSSDSPFIMDSPLKNSIVNTYTPMGDKTEYQTTNQRGKQHNRARGVLRQLQSGRLTLHNTTLLPRIPIGRGRGFESFVGGLLELQPGIDGTLQNVTTSSDIHLPGKDRTYSTFLKSNVNVAFPKISSLKRGQQNTRQTTRLFQKGNKTVLSQESPLPVTGSRCSVRGNRRVTRIEKPFNASNVAVKISPSDHHNVSNFRSTFHELSNEVDTIDSLPWTARDAILSRCNQTDPLQFSEHFNETTLHQCKKIGEGVYGEVFTYCSKLGTTVFKVIPIEGDLLVNGEPQKTFTEILSEILITMELSNLRYGTEQKCYGYAELRRTWCVQGEYPDFLLDLWIEYDLRKGSENDSPSMFPEKQLYIILELAHGGVDLEAFVFRNAAQSLSAFRQAAFSLAVAESALEFEHRDFHWGNVLISETSEKYVKISLDGQQIQIASEGVKVTIIDFTLSRITFEDCSVFNELSVDPTLFTSEGDYQFDIYRMMKDETKNNWEQFTPRTNVFWLHYTLDKMLSLVRYSRPKSKTHSPAVRQLRRFKEFALQFPNSAKFAVSTM